MQRCGLCNAGALKDLAAQLVPKPAQDSEQQPRGPLRSFLPRCPRCSLQSVVLVCCACWALPTPQLRVRRIRGSNLIQCPCRQCLPGARPMLPLTSPLLFFVVSICSDRRRRARPVRVRPRAGREPGAAFRADGHCRGLLRYASESCTLLSRRGLLPPRLLRSVVACIHGVVCIPESRSPLTLLHRS